MDPTLRQKFVSAKAATERHYAAISAYDKTNAALFNAAMAEIMRRYSLELPTRVCNRICRRITGDDRLCGVLRQFLCEMATQMTLLCPGRSATSAARPGWRVVSRRTPGCIVRAPKRPHCDDDGDGDEFTESSGENVIRAPRKWRAGVGSV